MTEASYHTPKEAEAAFYAAFQERNLDAMMAVWASDQDIVCVHPAGSMLIGREAIRASWEEIFRHGPEMKFVIDERALAHDASVAMHVVQEHIRIAQEMQPPVFVTNVYRRTDQGWRMVLHHASPSPRTPQQKNTLH